ncbi:hypothetical protein OG946_15465 [Streptomyces sp. NBC_01808]|uniref:hypothetical protein n=1 Tax=Streptomyces sp. NBC_01808 TaxID=2975947 RepID=UPI002DD989D4|nr:hypothetical protein [Streptomyces sp. NBC_01808]WSA38653.1 hypothetical protein OG946_15465 [Streptomyces sp. NBC_01808]
MVREHKDGGPTLTFDEPLPSPGAEPAVSTLGQLVHGIRRLWPLVRPLSAEAIIGCLDRETSYPDIEVRPQRPHWFIHERAAARPAGRQGLDVLDPWHVDPVVEPVADLSAAAIESWLARAQAQASPAPGTHDVGWTDLWFNATRALVPGPYAPDATAHVALHVAEVRAVANVPLQWREGTAWVAGPTREMRQFGARAPITLHASNYGLVELAVSANWSLWSEDGSPGRTALIDVARDLVADGWCVTHGTEFFHELA